MRQRLAALVGAQVRRLAGEVLIHIGNHLAGVHCHGALLETQIDGVGIDEGNQVGPVGRQAARIDRLFEDAVVDLDAVGFQPALSS